MGTLTREKEESSVTRLGEISPLWQTFNIFRHWCTRDSLTAPIHDHFVQVSLKIVDFLHFRIFYADNRVLILRLAQI